MGLAYKILAVPKVLEECLNRTQSSLMLNMSTTRSNKLSSSLQNHLAMAQGHVSEPRWPQKSSMVNSARAGPPLKDLKAAFTNSARLALGCRNASSKHLCAFCLPLSARIYLSHPARLPLHPRQALHILLPSALLIIVERRASSSSIKTRSYCSVIRPQASELAAAGKHVCLQARYVFHCPGR